MAPKTKWTGKKRKRGASRRKEVGEEDGETSSKNPIERVEVVEEEREEDRGALSPVVKNEEDVNEEEENEEDENEEGEENEDGGETSSRTLGDSSDERSKDEISEKNRDERLCFVRSPKTCPGFFTYLTLLRASPMDVF
ncbi:unnamed protein product [Arabidopsis lyrata]|nr:unnamed protein product [Arabidopsis lyrata]